MIHDRRYGYLSALPAALTSAAASIFVKAGDMIGDAINGRTDVQITNRNITINDLKTAFSVFDGPTFSFFSTSIKNDLKTKAIAQFYLYRQDDPTQLKALQDFVSPSLLTAGYNFAKGLLTQAAQQAGQPVPAIITPAEINTYATAYQQQSASSLVPGSAQALVPGGSTVQPAPAGSGISPAAMIALGVGAIVVIGGVVWLLRK